MFIGEVFGGCAFRGCMLDRRRMGVRERVGRYLFCG
jgi:hypothetical protein